MSILSRSFEGVTSATSSYLGVTNANANAANDDKCGMYTAATGFTAAGECLESGTGISQAGICQYTDCQTATGNAMTCQFPFRFALVSLFARPKLGYNFTNSLVVCFTQYRYKNRLYDSCVTFESSTPWCATRTDANHNYVEGYKAACGATCSVNNCPVGYYRLHPDHSCYRVRVQLRACAAEQACIITFTKRAQRLINLEIPVLVRSLKSSNVELS